MTTRPTIYTNINAANAEIQDMQTHMGIMKRMISVQSKRIENLKAIIEVLDKRIDSNNEIHENQLRLMEVWIKMLKADQIGLVMESIDRTVGNARMKENI